LDGTAVTAAGGGAGTFGVSPLASYAAAAAGGGPAPAELVSLGGLQLGGYSGDLSQAFGPVHDSMFQPSLLNVIMRSSTSTVTTTTTTSLGVLPTSTTLHLHHHHPAAAAAASAAAEATASLAAAGYPFMQAPPPPAAAAASAASVAGGRGGRTFSTAIEVDSDEDMPALEAAAAAHHF
jgi:hypothetical protein